MNKRFTDFFIQRPVFAIVIQLILLLAGVLSIHQLAVREYPAISASTLSITTTYAGASAEVIEAQVTHPIENALSNQEGLEQLTSSSSEGESKVIANFKLGYPLNQAVSDVISKLTAVRKKLPKDCDEPVLKKQDPNAVPVMYLAFSSPLMPRVAIHDYLNRNIVPIFGSLDGVGSANVFGQLDYAMRIDLNPWKMAGAGVTFSDIKTAILKSNVLSATGEIQTSTQNLATNLKSQLNKPEDFAKIVVQQKNNFPVYLDQLAHVYLGTTDIVMNAFIDGTPGNMLGIIPRSDANPLQISQEVYKVLQHIQSLLPAKMSVAVVWDNAKFISASLKEVIFSIFISAIGVIIVLFFFIGSARALLIPSVTIPLSIIICAIPMYALGYSINTLTLLAMVLAIGMVVDDAIVVAENIHRHIHHGLSTFDAAIKGAREIAFAVIAMTLTLAAVYAPMVFMQGLTGELFREFAFTLTAAVVISGFIALTLSPMMCSKILADVTQTSSFEIKINAFTERLAFTYQKILRQLLLGENSKKWRNRILGFCSVLFIIGISLYFYLPEELAPQEDMGSILAIMNAPDLANLSYTQKYALEADKVFAKIPEIAHRLLILGVPDGESSAIAFLPLIDWSQRSLSENKIIQALKKPLKQVIGLETRVINPFHLPGSTGFLPVQLVVKTTGSYSELYQVTQDILKEAKDNKALQGLKSDLDYNLPEQQFIIKRELAANLGVSVQDIADTLNLALSKDELNTFMLNGQTNPVIPALAADYRNTSSALKQLYLRSSTNNLIPLSSVIQTQSALIPGSLNHFQGMRAVTFSALNHPGYTLNDATLALEKIIKPHLKPDMMIDFSGQSRQWLQTQGNLGMLLLLAILFIYLVLSAQFESFKQPLIIMFTVPLSMTGALIILWVAGASLNIYTQIGLVTLVGLITKHGILLVEFARSAQKNDGLTKIESVIQAASIRLRPILMTTASMILGALPLVFAHGAGSVSRHQMGLVIVGGMGIGTLLTLFVIPFIYTLQFEHFKYIFRTYEKR